MQSPLLRLLLRLLLLLLQLSRLSLRIILRHLPLLLGLKLLLLLRLNPLQESDQGFQLMVASHLWLLPQ